MTKVLKYSCHLGDPSKKKLRNFGHVAKFLDPPPLGRYGRKKFGCLEWGRTPGLDKVG